MQKPLAFRIRPSRLQDIVGQQHIIGPGKTLTTMIEAKRLFSMILFGPPGNGKTTIANALANELQLPCRFFNAVIDNKKALVTIFEESSYYDNLVLIVDEVHRLNKDKQDLLLPYVESGKIIMIGATTSNPFFAINPAIRSRCHLIEVKRLAIEDMEEVIRRAISHPDGLHNTYTFDTEVITALAHMANGDVRFALNIVDLLATTTPNSHIAMDFFKQAIQYANMAMDHDDDNYYDTLSAFQKSIRGSDADAAIYYLARLLTANDLDSIERRLLVIAYEDIGLANPAAVGRTIAAIDAAKRIGMPEAMIPLANAVVDLALSPKSKSTCNAIGMAMAEVEQHAYQIPEYLRLTPVHMNQEDAYDYDLVSSWHHIQYLPDELKNAQFFFPNDTGPYEKALGENYRKLKAQGRTNQLAPLKQRLRNKGAK